VSYHDEDRRKVAAGTVLTVIGGLWLAGFKALGFVLRAVFGGPAYGLFAIVQSATELLAYLLLGGFNDAIVYFASRHVHDDRDADTEDGLYRALATCIGVPLLAAIAIAGLIELAVPWLFSAFLAQHDPLIVHLMRVLPLVLPLAVLVLLPAEATKAHLDFRWPVLVVQIIFPTSAFVLVLVLHYLFGMGIEALPLALVSAAAASVPFSLYAFSRHFSIAQTLRAALTRPWDREVLGFAGPQSLNMMLTVGLVRVNAVILARFTSANDVGLYTLVADLTQFIRVAKLAFSSVFAPLVAKYRAQHNRNGIREAVHGLVQVTSTLGVLLLIPAMTLYPHLILKPGEAWTASLWIPWLLAVAPMMDCFFGLAGNLLLMTGHSRLLLANAVIVGSMNVALNYLLIQQWGLFGAAIGTAISAFLLWSLQVVEMRSVEQISFRIGLYDRTALAAAAPLGMAASAGLPAFVSTVVRSGLPLLVARVGVAAAAMSLFAAGVLAWPSPNPWRNRLARLARGAGRPGVGAVESVDVFR